MKPQAENYKSVWQDKTTPAIENEIIILKSWCVTMDKYKNKEDLYSSEKLDILNEILGERG